MVDSSGGCREELSEEAACHKLYHYTVYWIVIFYFFNSLWLKRAEQTEESSRKLVSMEN